MQACKEMDFPTIFSEDSSFSGSSSSSTDTGQEEEEISSANCYDFSEIFNQLPIKRGLSRHYDGKSQSFTALSDVNTLEDLKKNNTPCNKKIKLCRIYKNDGLDVRKTLNPLMGCKHNSISKRSSKSSSCPSLLQKNRSIGTRPQFLKHSSPLTYTTTFQL